MADWKFRRRPERCGVCERVFEEGERYASLLAIRGEELHREDACAACWAGRGGAPGDELFFWFTRHRAARRRALQLDLGSLEALFEKLAPRAETPVRELRFVLCLLLMRKRRLKLERVVRDAEGEAMLVRKPRRKDLARVSVFDFTPERLAELKDELREVFAGAELAEEPAGGDGDADEDCETELAASAAPSG